MRSSINASVARPISHSNQQTLEAARRWEFPSGIGKARTLLHRPTTCQPFRRFRKEALWARHSARSLLSVLQYCHAWPQRTMRSPFRKISNRCICLTGRRSAVPICGSEFPSLQFNRELHPLSGFRDLERSLSRSRVLPLRSNRINRRIQQLATSVGRHPLVARGYRHRCAGAMLVSDRLCLRSHSRFGKQRLRSI